MSEGKIKNRVKEMLITNGVLPFREALAQARDLDREQLGDDAVKLIPGYFQMPASNGMGEAGIGDFLVCLGGRYMEIETKDEGGTQRGIQKAHGEVVSAAGGDYFLVIGDRGMNEFEPFFIDLIQETERIRKMVIEAMTEADEEMEKYEAELIENGDILLN